MRLPGRLRAVVLGLVLIPTVLLASPPTARAQKAVDTLRVTWRDAIDNLDPYDNPLRTGLILAFHVWDCLVYRDPETLQIKPALATAWQQVDDRTIEFTLRDGVTFQDGSAFSADDVVYTIASIAADKNLAVPSNYDFIAGADKIDATHVRIRLNRVFPAALEYIAMVMPILPRAYREKVGGAAFDRAPIGTGPYRFTNVGPSSIDLERYDDHYAASPKGKPAIRFIHVREVATAADELSDLLGGQADWIWDFDASALPKVAETPGLQALTAETMRIAYMQLDVAGRSGADNPLTKQTVREAISHAIDRASMARQLAGLGSRPLDAPCYPTQFGCDSATAVHYAYDPAMARSLLTQAGYPDGFDTELVSFVLPQWTNAVHDYLAAVGIRAKVAQLSTNDAVQRSGEGRNPLDMGTWGSYSINDVSAILPRFFGGGAFDYLRDQRVEALVEQGGTTTDIDQRRHAYAEAIRLITQKASFVPLFSYVKTYGFSRQLNSRPTIDEIPRFYLSSWR
jgi:peptide/nickel transport system substrate-binding protein